MYWPEECRAWCRMLGASETLSPAHLPSRHGSARFGNFKAFRGPPRKAQTAHHAMRGQPWQVQAALMVRVPAKGLCTAQVIPGEFASQCMILQCEKGPFSSPRLLLQAPHVPQDSSVPEKAEATGYALQAAKQLVAAALASLQVAAVPFAAELARPAPAAAVLNSPNARIARRCL